MGEKSRGIKGFIHHDREGERWNQDSDSLRTWGPSHHLPSRRGRPQLGLLHGALEKNTGFQRSFWQFLESEKGKHTKNNFKTKGTHCKPPGPRAGAVLEVSRSQSQTKKNHPTASMYEGHFLLSRSPCVSSPAPQPVGFSVFKHGRLSVFLLADGSAAS